MCSQLMFAERGDAREEGTAESRSGNEAASTCKIQTCSCMFWGLIPDFEMCALTQCNCEIAKHVFSVDVCGEGDAREEGTAESRSGNEAASTCKVQACSCMFWGFTPDFEICALTQCNCEIASLNIRSGKHCFN